MKQWTQEPANCNLELLHEILDTVIKSLWIDPDSRNTESPYNINNTPGEISNSDQFPEIKETAQINAHLKELKTIVGFLHAKLNERAESIKFEWEESLAFAGPLESAKQNSPSLERLATTNFATYLSGSLSPERLRAGSESSCSSSIDSPVDDLLHRPGKNTHRYSWTSSASSLSGSIPTTQHKAQNQNSTSPGHVYRLATVPSPEQSRRHSLIPRATASGIPFYSSPPALALPVVPPFKTTPAVSPKPGYLSSTASSRAYAQPMPTDKTLQRANSVASTSRNLRHRSSMPAINRASTQQFLHQAPQQLNNKPISSLYAVYEDVQHNRHSSSSIIRRMSSTSVLRDSYSYRSSPKPTRCTANSTVDGSTSCMCTQCVDNWYLSDQDLRDATHYPSPGLSAQSSNISRARSPLNQMHNNSQQYYGSPLRHQSQLRDTDYLKKDQVSTPAIRVVSDPTRSSSVYSYHDTY